MPKQDLAELNSGIARLRAAKHASADRYRPSTVKDTLPSTDEVSTEDTHTNTPASTPPENVDTVTTSAITDPSDTTASLNTQSTDWEKRYGDSRREVQQLKDQIKEFLEQDNQEPVKLPKTEEQINDWAKKNPEHFDLLVSVIAQQNKPVAEEIQKAKSTLAELQRQSRNEQIFQEVLKSHPDAGTIRESDDFKDWFATQTAATQALVDSSNSSDVSRGISLYKLDKGITTKPSNAGKTAEDASYVSTKSTVSLPKEPKVWKASDIMKLSPVQYERYREEIKAAKREGRYDPTS